MKGRATPVPPTLVVCRCSHERMFHKRGWGPCTFVCNTAVLGEDGGQYVVVEPCDCRRFVTANHPAGKARP